MSPNRRSEQRTICCLLHGIARGKKLIGPVGLIKAVAIGERIISAIAMDEAGELLARNPEPSTVIPDARKSELESISGHRRALGKWPEAVCAENTRGSGSSWVVLTPQAEKPDF